MRSRGWWIALLVVVVIAVSVMAFGGRLEHWLRHMHGMD
jgi:hypothetical protein